MVSARGKQNLLACCKLRRRRELRESLPPRFQTTAIPGHHDSGPFLFQSLFYGRARGSGGPQPAGVASGMDGAPGPRKDKSVEGAAFEEQLRVQRAVLYF